MTETNVVETAVRPKIIEKGAERIIGKVFEGDSLHEAITIDDSGLNQAYLDFVNKIDTDFVANGFTSGKIREGLLSYIYRFVKERMPFDQARMENMHKRLSPEDKVNLSSFVNDGAGLGRHRTLFFAYLLEKSQNENVSWAPRGKVSIEWINLEGGSEKIWAKYINSAGDESIIDLDDNPDYDFMGRASKAGEDRQKIYEKGKVKVKAKV